MDKTFEKLIEMVVSKPINITVNIHGGIPGTTPLEPIYDHVLEGDDTCELCDCSDVAEDCTEAQYSHIWSILKQNIINGIPESSLKTALLTCMEALEHSILD